MSLIKHKPVLNGEIANLFDEGVTIHMLEFSGFLSEYFKNFCNALAGKSTGPCSNADDRFSFDEKSKMFLSMPVSAVKTGFPFELYLQQNIVGVVIDPKKAKFSYIDVSDSQSHIDKDTGLVIIRESVNKEDLFLELNRLNMGTDGRKTKDDYGNAIEFPAIRDANTEKALRNFFFNKFFEVYSQGHAVDSAEFKERFYQIQQDIKKHGDSIIKGGIGLMSEIGINVNPTEGISAIVLSPARMSEVHLWHHGDENALGVSAGYLLQQIIKENTGKELPIISYSSLQRGKMMEVREIDVEARAIQSGLKEVEGIKKVFVEYLGEERTKQLELGRMGSTEKSF